MNVNLHLVGEAEAYINSLVRRGLAASKTEAVRLCIVKCRDAELAHESEARAAEQLQAPQLKVSASRFYEEKYGNAKKG